MQDKQQTQLSAKTLIKMEDAPTLLKIPKSECPDIWIRLPKHKWPKSWSSMEGPVVPLERNLYGHPLPGPLWERQFEKVLVEHEWEKVPNWECLFVHHEKGLFLSVYVDDIKFVGKKQNIDPMWKVLNKEVDLGEPTSFLDHVYLDCTQKRVPDKQRYCGTVTGICSNQGFLPDCGKNYQKQNSRRNLMPKRYLYGPMTWKVMQRNACKEKRT